MENVEAANGALHGAGAMILAGIVERGERKRTAVSATLTTTAFDRSGLRWLETCT